MKIISWNINGIRASRKKGFDEFIRKENPDIICVQETKAQKKVLREEDFTIEGYNNYWSEGIKAGYSGTSIWVKKSIDVLKFQDKIEVEEFDNEGRTNIIETTDFFLVNSYYPNGREDHSRVDYKLRYSYKILELAKEMEKKKPVILTGDFNTAHKEIDLARPLENLNTTGFLPNERAFLNNLENAGFIDAFRYKHKEVRDVYSWWSYRGGAKFRNVGWRIDYFWTSKSIESKILNVYYVFDENASDHCPVVLEIGF